MNRSKAAALLLGDLNYPVVTSYHLGLIVHKIYRNKNYKGEAVNQLRKRYADRTDFNAILNKLQDEGILTTYKGIASKFVFGILGRTLDVPLDIICTIDPFCYISHLNAMEYHGLTDRIPKRITVSTPAPKEWRILANKRMEKDLGDDLTMYLSNRMPKLQQIKIEKIGRTPIEKIGSMHLGAYKAIRGRALRVSTIGRTFFDMLKNPELCGGINHILNVFDEFADQYLKLILDELDQHGGAIDKVRAGYILDERLGLSHGIIDSWEKFVQRGGSRKLDPSAEYEPIWSDKWCLSLNIIEKEKLKEA